MKFPFPVVTEIRKRLKKAGTKNFELESYRFECRFEDAVLLPRHERTHEVPGGVRSPASFIDSCSSMMDRTQWIT